MTGTASVSSENSRASPRRESEDKDLGLPSGQAFPILRGTAGSRPSWHGRTGQPHRATTESHRWDTILGLIPDGLEYFLPAVEVCPPPHIVCRVSPCPPLREGSCSWLVS